MIEIKDFALAYGRRMLLQDGAAVFSPGRLTALIGRNGTGKSTLLRAMAGLNRNYNGELLIDSLDERKLKPEQLAKKLAFVNSGHVRIPNLTCHDVVAMGRAPYTDWIGRLGREDEEMVERALALTGMQDFAGRTLDTMSDGECQRIMISRALAQDTPNILLDEPTSFLDLPSRYELTALLSKLAHEQGKMILFSTHELDIASKICDDIALLADKTLYLMTAAEMAKSNLIEEKFGLDFSTFNLSTFSIGT